MQRYYKPGFAVLVLAALWLAACGATPPVTTAQSTDESAKISPVLMQAAQQLQRGGSLSVNGPVRSDAQGRIQVYVHVSDTSAAALTALASRGLQDTVLSPQMHIVQGWVRPADLMSLATLPFVIYITPPTYGKPR